MRFKEWLASEGEYGTSAAGEVGGFNPVGPNDDRNYAEKGIGSRWSSSDRRKKRFSGLKNDGSPLRSSAGYDADQPPRRVAAGFV